MTKALRKFKALSPEERKTQETTQGFKSFGTLADEFYETVDPEQFKSIEEIQAFVAEHSDYLQLIQDENGEYTVEVVAYDNPYRYLANKDLEIKVDGKLCKVTEKAVVDAHTEVQLEWKRRSRQF